MNKVTGIKQIIHSILEKTAGAYISMSKIKDQQFLTILTYHSINYPSRDLPIDEDVISCSPELFDLEMQFCKKYFTPITFSTLKKCLLQQERLPKMPLIITFDDGYKDNFTYALPVLNKYEIPATIFLATGYIGESKLFWWDEITYILNNYNKSELHIEINHTKHILGFKTTREKRKSIRHLRRILKFFPNNQREDIIRYLASLSNLNEKKFDVVLNWEDIKLMAARGIEFGSHSVTHSIMSMLSDEELKKELSESKKSIERHTDKEVIAFSYPYGTAKDFHSKMEDFLKAAGYSFAVSYIEGVNRIGNFNEFAMKRISSDGITLKLFKIKLAFSKIMF